ncbi:hypothetical protein [Brevundimonas vesicularis]|nr:hypothetical protein [Brevundimonas vesicularis]
MCLRRGLAVEVDGGSHEGVATGTPAVTPHWLITA